MLLLLIQQGTVVAQQCIVGVTGLKTVLATNLQVQSTHLSLRYNIEFEYVVGEDQQTLKVVCRIRKCNEYLS